MSVLSSAQVTLAWSAGILATVRYYQLAAPTAATPAVPTSSSSLGSWTETEPTADVTKVLWTCERTVYTDGTESWSKASKSTSYEAAKDAKSTANDAQKTAGENKDAINTAQKDQSDWNGRTEGRIVAVEKSNAGFESSINTLSGAVGTLTDDVSGLKDTQTSIKSYMTFTDPNGGNPKLTIGTSSSKMKSELGNTKLAFVSDDTEVASIDGETSTLNAQRVQIGTYRWMPTNGGSNLTLVYVG